MNRRRFISVVATSAWLTPLAVIASQRKDNSTNPFLTDAEMEDVVQRYVSEEKSEDALCGLCETPFSKSNGRNCPCLLWFRQMENLLFVVDMSTGQLDERFLKDGRFMRIVGDGLAKKGDMTLSFIRHKDGLISIIGYGSAIRRERAFQKFKA